MFRSPNLLRSLKQAAQDSGSSQISYVTSRASGSINSGVAIGRVFSTAAAPVTETIFNFARVRELAQLYKQLSKAKLSALVVSTTAAGFVAGSGDSIDWKKLGWTYIGTTAAASSANALNQIYEVTNDSLMKRTQRRPLPAGKMSMAHALAFAAVTGLGGIGVLASQVNCSITDACQQTYVLPLLVFAQDHKHVGRLQYVSLLGFSVLDRIFNTFH